MDPTAAAVLTVLAVVVAVAVWRWPGGGAVDAVTVSLSVPTRMVRLWPLLAWLAFVRIDRRLSAVWLCVPWVENAAFEGWRLNMVVSLRTWRVW